MGGNAAPSELKSKPFNIPEERMGKERKRRRWIGQKSSSKKWEVVQPKDKSPKSSSTTTHHKY